MEIPLPLASWFVLWASYSQQNLLPQHAPRRETFLRGVSLSPGFFHIFSCVQQELVVTGFILDSVNMKLPLRL